MRHHKENQFKMPSESNKPARDYASTYYNSRIQSFDKLGQRILYQFGYPLVKVEIHRNSLYDSIAQAVEIYSRYAGFTEEYLVFDSNLHTRGVGVRLDELFTNTPEMRALRDADATTWSTETNETSAWKVDDHPTFSNNDATSACYIEDDSLYPRGYDKDMDDYRKVIDVFCFNEGTSTGINTLFTIEQSLAQQTYFSYALGNYGFDLTTWHVLKEWLDMRRKLLAQEYYFRFDPRTQMLRILPEPRSTSRFFGLVGCYVERPVADLIKEKWVYRYALALIKQKVGHVRGKYNNTVLFGGGTVNATDLMTQGIKEQGELEEQVEGQHANEEFGTGFFVG